MRKIMTIRPTDELRARLKAIAEEKGMTVNGLVLWILSEYVKEV